MATSKHYASYTSKTLKPDTFEQNKTSTKQGSNVITVLHAKTAVHAKKHTGKPYPGNK